MWFLHCSIAPVPSTSGKLSLEHPAYVMMASASLHGRRPQGSVIKATQKIGQWQEGPVDRTKEHFELRYGPTVKFESGWNDWTPVALVGRPQSGVVNVHFLIDADNPKNAKVIVDVKREIQFYLIDKRELNPWGYAEYHCGTCANIYSNVH